MFLYLWVCGGWGVHMRVPTIKYIKYGTQKTIGGIQFSLSPTM